MPRRFFGKTPSEDEGEQDEEMDASKEEVAPESKEIEEGVDADADPMEVQLKELEIQVAEGKDKYLRILAELENVKKRNAKERSELQRYAGEHLAQDLLVVLDDLQRAVEQSADSNAEEILAGVKMITSQFSAVFEKHGIVSRDALGEDFDPKVHDALASVPTADHPAGKVIEQLKKAYFFRDKLLRPAQVVVSAQMQQPQEEKEDGEGEPEE